MTIKICLTGNTGVGKDTFFKIVENEFGVENVEKIQLGAPLYDVQDYIYKLCKVKKEYHIQDGELLNFLGQHMRIINPEVLKIHFLEKMSKLKEGSNIVLCIDARPVDLSFVRKKGFIVVNIIANEQITKIRREKRGDISLGDPKHITEKHDVNEYDYKIYNNDSVYNFKTNILALMRQIYDSYWARNQKTSI